MKRSDQKRIVKDLLEATRRKITFQIDHGQVPEEWDGNHLRLLVEHNAVGDAARARVSLGTRGVREFENDVAVRNL